MGVSDFRAANGAIEFVTSSRDPAIGVTVGGAPAAKHPCVVVRMKIDPNPEGRDSAQLFWSTTTSPITEATSVRFDLVSDGAYHEYRLDVRANRRWRGRINTLRFDPCSRSGARVSIASVRLADSEM